MKTERNKMDDSLAWETLQNRSYMMMFNDIGLSRG